MTITPLKVGLAQIAAMTGESMPTIRRAIAEGHLQTFLVGRRRFARPDAVKDWCDFLERESAAGRPVTYRSRAAEGRATP